MFSSDIKPIEHYNKLKHMFNKRYNKEWKSIAGPCYIGYCSYLFQDFRKKWDRKELPEIKDFADYYFSNINPIKEEGIYKPNSKYYGRTVDDLVELAKKYQSKTGNYTITLEDYFDDIINHAIVETYGGQMAEEFLIKEYTDKGFDCEHTYGFMDKDLGVDIIVKRNGNILQYVQCKPISTFCGRFNNSLIEDRINFFHKEEKKKIYCSEHNIPYYETIFVLYNSEYPKKWCTLKGKTRRSFLLNELCDTNGMPLIDFNKDVEYK